MEHPTPTSDAVDGYQKPTSSSIPSVVARRLESALESGLAQCFEDDGDSGSEDTSLTARRLQHKARRRHILTGESGLSVAGMEGVDDLASSCSNAPTSNEFGLPEQSLQVCSDVKPRKYHR